MQLAALARPQHEFAFGRAAHVGIALLRDRETEGAGVEAGQRRRVAGGEFESREMRSDFHECPFEIEWVDHGHRVLAGQSRFSFPEK